MLLIPKWYSLLILCVFFCVSFEVSGQSNQKKINLDSSKTISLVEFNQRVDRAIELLKTKQLAEISDTDHINIMMCLNTIFMTDKPYSIEKVFVNGRYQELEEIEREKNYERNIVKVYPEWILDRGMGFYFPKLKMELYGTPHLYAIFNVVR